MIYVNLVVISTIVNYTYLLLNYLIFERILNKFKNNEYIEKIKMSITLIQFGIYTSLFRALMYLLPLLYQYLQELVYIKYLNIYVGICYLFVIFSIYMLLFYIYCFFEESVLGLKKYFKFLIFVLFISLCMLIAITKIPKVFILVYILALLFSAIAFLNYLRDKDTKLKVIFQKNEKKLEIIKIVVFISAILFKMVSEFYFIEDIYFMLFHFVVIFYYLIYSYSIFFEDDFFFHFQIFFLLGIFILYYY